MRENHGEEFRHQKSLEKKFHKSLESSSLSSIFPSNNQFELRGSDIYDLHDNFSCISTLWISILEEIQRFTRSQVCSLFLLNDNGKYERAAIYGFDKTGRLLTHRHTIKESYIIGPTTPIFGRLIQSNDTTDDLFQNCVFTNSLRSDFPVDSIKRIFDEIESVCGIIKQIALIPVKIHGNTLGILRVFNRLFDDNSDESDSSYTKGDLSYLLWITSKIESLIVTRKYIHDMRLIGKFQKHTLKLSDLINQQCGSGTVQLGPGLSRAICNIFYEIIHELVNSDFGPIKAANLRLSKSNSNTKEHICVAYYTKNEDGHKNRYPRYSYEKNLSLVSDVVQTGKDVLIREVTEQPMLARFINHNHDWIIMNEFKDFLCIAIIVNGVPVGTLSLFTSKNRRLSTEDCIYYKSFVKNLSVLLSNLFACLQCFETDCRDFMNKFLTFVEEARTPPIPDAQSICYPTSQPKIKEDKTNSDSELIARTKNIFISFSKADTNVVRALQEKLVSFRFNISSSRLVRDRDFTNYSKTRDLKLQIEGCGVFLIVLSRTSIRSEIQLEWNLILEAYWSQTRNLIIPIALGSVQLPIFLSEFQSIDLPDMSSLSECSRKIRNIIHMNRSGMANPSITDDDHVIRAKYKQRYNLLRNNL